MYDQIKPCTIWWTVAILLDIFIGRKSTSEAARTFALCIVLYVAYSHGHVRYDSKDRPKDYNGIETCEQK